MQFFFGVNLIVFINLQTIVNSQTIKDTNECVFSIDFVDIKSSPTNTANRYLNCTCNGKHLYYADNGEPITTTIHKCNDFCASKDNYCPQDLNTILAQNCPTHWLRFGQKCYYSPPNSVGSWDNARELCKSLSAHMLKIESREENNFVEAYLETLEQNIFWLGARKEGNDFLWQDGTNITFANWYPGEPDNEYGNQDCLSLVGKNAYPGNSFWAGHEPGVWDDIRCADSFLAICETYHIH